MCDSGGSSPSKEQNDMYAATAHQANLASGAYEQYGLPGIARMERQGNDYKSNANKSRVSDTAMADSAAAYGNAMRMADANQSGYGGPTSERAEAVRRGGAATQAAGAAGAAENARENQDRMGNALLADSTSLGLGQAATAQNAMNAASSTANAMQNQSNWGAQQNANAWGSAAGAAGWGISNWSKIKEFFAADGGEVPERGYAGGGPVSPTSPRFSGAAGLNPNNIQPVQNPNPPPSSGGGPLGSAMSTMSALNTATKLVDKYSSGLTGAQTAPVYSPAAPVGVDLPSMGSMAGMEAAPTGAALSGATGVGEAVGGAAGLGEAAAGAGLAAETAAATGAATAATSIAPEALALLLLREGGAVPKAGIGRGSRLTNGRAENPSGGTVRGAGGPKDDMVPARLSPGEFVMPVEAVSHFGLKKLESMRQEALRNPRRN